MSELLQSDSGLDMDLMLHFERLGNHVSLLFARLGIDAGIFPHRNQGLQDRPWRRYYHDDPELIDYVGELFREDVERFEYRFVD